MESTLSPAVDFSVLFELESSPYESTYEASAAGPITNAEAEYYEDDEGKECRKTTALEMSEILTRIFVATDGWPKRIGDSGDTAPADTAPGAFRVARTKLRSHSVVSRSRMPL